nr:UDP-glucose/GDP-mannose dehydrogenase family protein [Paenibacillus flagellatus]
MNVAVIGTGYVGLVTGACLAEAGHRVVCADRDEVKIGRLRTGVVPIYEPGLEELVRANAEAGRLRFASDAAEAVASSDVVLFAVGTPPLANGDVDTGPLFEAVAEAAAHTRTPKLFAIKSTVPVGTARKAERLVARALPRPVKVDVVSNPEFLREGSAIRDTFEADRIVIGCADPEAGERLAGLYEPFGRPVQMTDRESAELIKYAANAFLAVKISFINEVANVCEKVGADIRSVARGIGADRRIGPHFLNAGIGYGGSCFPKDTKAQLRIAENVEYDFQILRAAVHVNAMQRIRFANAVERTLGGSLAGKRVAVLGLAFKPHTDDVRDAPAIDIIRLLHDKGADVRAYDPVATANARRHLPDVELFDEPYGAIAGADAIVVTTEWPQVAALDLDRVKRLMTAPVVLDGRRAFEPEAMRARGFRYVGVGIPAEPASGT